jgi:hypothetical protein
MNPSVNGVFMSRDSAKSWVPVLSGLKDSAVLSLAISGDYLLAGTRYSGVWRRPLSEMVTSVKPSPPEIPLLFGLDQNYPNPFNPSTTIRYAIPERVHVTLSIFNTLGQQVAVLVNENQEAGYHDVRFDGSGVASGVYYYRIQAGGYVKTMKMLTVR